MGTKPHRVVMSGLENDAPARTHDAVCGTRRRPPHPGWHRTVRRLRRGTRAARWHSTALTVLLSRMKSPPRGFMWRVAARTCSNSPLICSCWLFRKPMTSGELEREVRFMAVSFRCACIGAPQLPKSRPPAPHIPPSPSDSCDLLAAGARRLRASRCHAAGVRHGMNATQRLQQVGRAPVRRGVPRRRPPVRIVDGPRLCLPTVSAERRASRQMPRPVPQGRRRRPPHRADRHRTSPRIAALRWTRLPAAPLRRRTASPPA